MTKKQIILTTIISLATILTYNHIMSSIANKQIQQEAQTYKQCIIEQSETRGWIIRSECSLNYKQLDQTANLKYIQKGYDLYLTK